MWHNSDNTYKPAAVSLWLLLLLCSFVCFNWILVFLSIFLVQMYKLCSVDWFRHLFFTKIHLYIKCSLILLIKRELKKLRKFYVPCALHERRLILNLPLTQKDVQFDIFFVTQHHPNWFICQYFAVLYNLYFHMRKLNFISYKIIF